MIKFFLAEAMLNKLPVLATRVGGMKYIVDDKETGFLVAPFQVEEIAGKLEQLYQHPEMRKDMGRKGEEKAKREFTEEVYVGKIEKLYKNWMG